MRSQMRYGIGLIALGLASVIGAGHLGCRGNYTGTSDGGSELVGKTLSFFTAYQVDPRSEDSAGPQFVTAADLNRDGLTDLVSAWNQSQPVQVHLQHRGDGDTVSFETITLAGNVPVVSVAGVEVADFDGDDRLDIAVLVKVSLETGAVCLDAGVPNEETLSGMVLLYLGPDSASQANQALAWEELVVETSRLPAPSEVPATPEVGGFTSMAIGDVDLDGDTDIIVASNSSCREDAAGEVLVFSNLGLGSVHDGTWLVQALPDPFPRTTIKSAALADVDLDGDLDVVASFPDAPSMNIRWFRNPTNDILDDFHISDGSWQVGTVGQVPTGADLIQLADIDRDGITDVVVRSSGGAVIQWLKGPAGPTTAPIRAIPWQVYTMAEFTQRIPEAFALGDLNFDGQIEVVAAAQGGLAWFDPQVPASVYDQWSEHLIIDEGGDADDPATTDPDVEPQEVADTTFINSILIVDLDGDGANDLIVTLDRSGLSGVTNDALVWFRNDSFPPA